MAYLTTELREQIFCMAGCCGYLETLAEKPGIDKGSVQAAQVACEKILEDLQRGLNEYQLLGLTKTLKDMSLVPLPKANPKSSINYYIIETPILEELMQDVSSACMFCDKDDKEASKCRRRKLMLRAGLIPAGQKNCPYHG